MSVDLSKIGYGTLVSDVAADGLHVSKIGYGTLVSDVAADGLHVSKIGYGVLIDTLTLPPTSTRRRALVSIN